MDILNKIKQEIITYREQTPHVATSSKTLRSIRLIGSPKTTVII